MVSTEEFFEFINRKMYYPAVENANTFNSRTIIYSFQSLECQGVTSSTVGSLVSTVCLRGIEKQHFKSSESMENLEHSKNVSTDSLGFSVINQYPFKSTVV